MGGAGPESWVTGERDAWEKGERELDLKYRINSTLEKAGGIWGVIAVPLRGHLDYPKFHLNHEESFPAASLAKLPIVIFACGQIMRGKSSYLEPLVVREECKRPGTGMLQHFPEGFEVTLDQAMALMLIVSDNTAAKLVVDRFGVNRINEHLEKAWGLKVTRLQEQAAGGFTYGHTTPHEVGHLLISLVTGGDFGLTQSLADWVLQQMQRCRFPFGIRRGIERLAAFDAIEVVGSGKLHKLKSKLGRTMQPQELLERTLKSRSHPLVANKEGSLDDTRNEVAIVFDDRPYLLVMLSKGLRDASYSPRNEGLRAIAKTSKLVRQLMQS